MSSSLRIALAKARLPLVVFAVGSALSLAFAYYARDAIARSAQLRFDADASVVARDVEGRFTAYTEVLVGLRALFNTSELVTRSQFREYVQGLSLKRNYPGFQVLNFAPYVSAERRLAFEESVRRDTSVEPAGYPRFAISPPGEREHYYPMTYVEPMAGNERVFGKDMAAMPGVLQSLERARDNGQLTSSGRLIQPQSPKAAAGLAMRLPVYRSGMPIATVEQRRAAYLGSVGAGFLVPGMIDDLVKSEADAGLRLRLFDGGTAGEPAVGGTNQPAVAVRPPGPDKLLFDSASITGGETAPADARPAQHAAVEAAQRFLPFEFGTRRWIIQVTADPQRFYGQLDRVFPWLILCAGLAISGLLAGIVYSLATSRGRAVGIATAMTRDLRTSERRLDEAQHLASLGSWLLDAQTGLLHCSDEAQRILEFDTAGAAPTLETLLARIPPNERDAVGQGIAAAERSGARYEFEHRVCLRDGTERWLHTIVQVTEEDGRTALRGTVRDDTQRKKAALRLTLEHEIARLLATEDDREVVIARAFEAICTQLRWDYAARWGVADDSQAHCRPIWHLPNDPSLEAFARVSREQAYDRNEGSLGRAWASGVEIWIDTAVQGPGFERDALAANAGLTCGVVLPLAFGVHPAALEFFSRKPHTANADADMLDTLRALAMQIAQYEQRKQAEHNLRHVATHDALTGLSNRVMLQQRLNQAIKRCTRHHKRMAVMFVDLDQFKNVNDTLGHGVGDVMIRACAARLSGILREGDTVARFGGDEFVLVLEDLAEPSDAIVVVDKVLRCCAQPFVIEGHELHVTASVGISIYPEDGSDGETLLKNADTAMYRAKEHGRGTHQFYAAQMNTLGAERFMLESALRRALERHELTLHYQPKMNLRTQNIAGVEALMRWNHPVLGNISPVQFIPIAEETGLIESMGKWALETACADARKWQQRGLPPVQVSVNLSVRQLNNPGLVADIAAILASTGLDAGLLELEITESAMMQNPNHAAALLQELRDMGVFLAIDDFGTGYSSLSYLKRFPLSTVKIDRSFVKDIDCDPDAAALSSAIISLAHGMRMKVVAEGVETTEQLSFLRAHDCDEMQGYLLCKPIPAEAVGEFMASHLRNLFASVRAA